MARPEILVRLLFTDNPNTESCVLAQAKLVCQVGVDGVLIGGNETGPYASAGGDLRSAAFARVLKRIANVSFVGLRLCHTNSLDASALALKHEADALLLVDTPVQGKKLTLVGLELTAFIRRGLKVFAPVAEIGATPKDVHPETSVRITQASGFTPMIAGRPGGGLTLARVKNLSAAAGGKLALSSHVTVENVARFAPYVSHVIVGDVVMHEDRPQQLDVDKLRQLIANAEH